MPDRQPPAQLSGTLNTMSLADLLQWLCLGNKTGTLHLQNGRVEKQIFFQDGRLVSASSNSKRELLGQFLLHHGRINEKILNQALSTQEKTGQILGRILVEEGHLSQEDLVNILQLKAEETIYDLFLWDEGNFHFVDGRLPAWDLIPMALDVTGLIMEGVRRKDEYGLIRETLPGNNIVLRISEARRDQIRDRAGFDGQLLKLIGEGRSIAEICIRSRAPEFILLKRIHELKVLGLVEVDRVLPESEEPPAEASAEDLLRTCRERLNEGEVDEGVKLLAGLRGSTELTPELMVELAELEGRAIELFYGSSLPPDSLPVLRTSMTELMDCALGPEEGFIISRITGTTDLGSIVKISPLSELDALLIFRKLLDERIIELEGRGAR